jgi:hypothetical protein
MAAYGFKAVGIAPDAVPETLPANLWSAAKNIYPREGMERAGGIVSAFGAPIFQPIWLLNTKSVNNPSFWIYGGDAGIGGSDGASAHTDLTPTTGFVGNVAANCWSGGNLNGVPVVCNGNIPLWWDGQVANNFVPVPGWITNYRARAVRPYQYHLIALNVDPATGVFNPDLVLWSSAAVPGTVPATWTPAPDNEAGSAQLSTSPGSIIDGGQLRNSFVIYKETSCFQMNYVGGAQVMTIAPLFTNVGVLARNCIAEVAGVHYVLTDGDIIAHDGQSSRSLADGFIRESFLAVIDQTNIQRCYVVPFTPPNEIWFAFPESGQTTCTKAAIWDVARERWGVRDLAQINSYHIAQGQVRLDIGAPLNWSGQTTTWANDPKLWNFSGPRLTRYSLLAAGYENDAATLFALQPGLFALDQSPGTLAGLTPGELVRVGLDFKLPEQTKTVSRVWIEAKGPTGTRLGVQLAGAMRVGEPVTFGAPVYVTIGGRMDAPIFANGKYIAVRVFDASTGPLGPWKLSGVMFDYQAKGAF